MKIYKIRLNNYLHFRQGLVIDLTYPAGHKKAGKPLDKICLLGQSGTGKTALLNLIKYFTCEENDGYDKNGIELSKIKKRGVEIYYDVNNKKKFSKVSSDKPHRFELTDHSSASSTKIPDSEIDAFMKKGMQPYMKNRTHTLLSFPFCVVGPQDIPNDSTDKLKQETLKFDAPTLKFDAPKGELEDDSYTGRTVWDFTPDNIKLIWKVVFKNVSEYIKEYQRNQLVVANKMIRDVDDKKPVDDFKQWLKQHPNPIQELADKCLNKILEKFNLEVETDIEKYPLENFSNERYIVIKSKNNGEEIKYPFLSTGTKQIMLTSIPLFFLRPSSTIILFDQPETSLYPNIQWILPRIYLDIAPRNNQFVFATHSPVVASSFDPWEVIELSFDNEKGEVYQKPYYDTRRVRTKGAYTIYPKLLRWDSSYKILFGLNMQGNDERILKLEELAVLEKKIKKEKSERKKKKLVSTYMSLAGKLDWNKS